MPAPRSTGRRACQSEGSACDGFDGSCNGVGRPLAAQPGAADARRHDPGLLHLRRLPVGRRRPATCQDIDLIGGPANCGNPRLANNCSNGTAQTTQNGTCADVAACAASGLAPAPALDATGMAAAGLLLAGLGLLQIVRRRA
ncbi:MAG: hypothetical protein U0802_10965 [Candidatus Binatia bacterium]